MEEGGSDMDWPVPKMRISGFGTASSKTSNISVSQPFQNVWGTFQRKTFPPKKIQEDVITSPSANSIPAGETLLTCTGCGGPPSNTFSNRDRLILEKDIERVKGL